MGTLDRAFEWFAGRVIHGFVGHLPGRVVLAIVVLLYAGIGLALPLGLGWSAPFLVDANLWGTILAGLVVLGWLLVQLDERDRRHLLEWTTELRHLDSREFEWLVGELFRREGWTVEETGRQGSPDGNIDLRLGRGRERKIVQCKRWTSWSVGVDDVRAFAGTLMREGLTGKEGVFVTFSNFTPQARAESERVGLRLIESRELYSMVEKARRAEPCPVCQTPMILGRSTYGWWFRCTAPGCAGKRDLGSDPALAVELLTQPSNDR